MATGTDHRPQKKAKPKRGDFREEVNAARTSSAHAALVSEPLAQPGTQARNALSVVGHHPRLCTYLS
jgi:hypothetical protein